MTSAINPAATSERELTTDELGHVSGGSFGGIRDILIGGLVQTLNAPLLRLQPGADGFWVGSPATAALMEKEIMSKTNDTSDFGQATLEDHRALADRELDAVSGGWSLSGIPGAGAATTPGHRALTHAVSGFFTNGGTRV